MTMSMPSCERVLRAQSRWRASQLLIVLAIWLAFYFLVFVPRGVPA